MYERGGQPYGQVPAGPSVPNVQLHEVLSPANAGISVYDTHQHEITAPNGSPENEAEADQPQPDLPPHTSPEPVREQPGGSQGGAPEPDTQPDVPRTFSVKPPIDPPTWRPELGSGLPEPNPRIDVKQFAGDIPRFRERTQVTERHTRSVAEALTAHGLYVDSDGPGAETYVDLYVEGSNGYAAIKVRANNEMTVGYFPSSNGLTANVSGTSPWETYYMDQYQTLRSDDNNFDARRTALPPVGSVSHAQLVQLRREQHNAQLLLREIDHRNGKEHREIGRRESFYLENLLAQAVPMPVAFDELSLSFDNRYYAPAKQHPTAEEARAAADTFGTYLSTMASTHGDELVTRRNPQTRELTGTITRAARNTTEALQYMLGSRIIPGEQGSRPFAIVNHAKYLDPQQLGSLPNFEKYKGVLSQLGTTYFDIRIRYGVVNGLFTISKAANVYTADGMPVTSLPTLHVLGDVGDIRRLRSAMRDPYVSA